VPVRLTVNVLLPVCSNVSVSVELTVIEPDRDAVDSKVKDMLWDGVAETSALFDRDDVSPDLVTDCERVTEGSVVNDGVSESVFV
jgi:hypothetical protein